MTAGLAILKNFSWSLKKKKARSLAWAGLSQGGEKKKYPVSDNVDDHPSCSHLEIVAPAISELEFRYNWHIGGFAEQMKTCKADGINSSTFEMTLNGLLTVWSLSIRFWIGGAGERLANPVVVCLNLVGCKVVTKQNVTVRYNFGVYNHDSREFEMGSSDKANIMMEETDKLQSVGYKNIAISDKHVSRLGGLLISVRFSIICNEKKPHSLSSDLGTLINDSKSSDLIVQAGDKTFKVHKNILTARSPVFANQLASLEENDQEKKSELSNSSGTSLLLAEENIKAVFPIDISEDLIRENYLQSSVKVKTTPKLIINNLPADTVEELLRYIYTDNPSAVDKFSHTLLAAADQYQLPGLKLHCEKHLSENISPLNVATVLLLSHDHKCPALKRTALAYCWQNHGYIMKDSGWKKIEKENPSLFSEAISCVATDLCNKHEDCIGKGSNRYQTETDRRQIPRKKSVLKTYSK